MTARLFHAVTCTETECDPPRIVDLVRRNRRGEVVTIVGVPLDGCPIGDPGAIAPVGDAGGSRVDATGRVLGLPEVTPGRTTRAIHTDGPNLWALAGEQARRGHDPEDLTVLREVQGG